MSCRPCPVWGATGPITQCWDQVGGGAVKKGGHLWAGWCAVFGVRCHVRRKNAWNVSMILSTERHYFNGSINNNEITMIYPLWLLRKETVYYLTITSYLSVKVCCSLHEIFTEDEECWCDFTVAVWIVEHFLLNVRCRKKCYMIFS